ncbi:hypothetical protein [Streptomyces sp. PA5.6]
MARSHAAVRAALRSPDADPRTFERLRTIADAVAVFEQIPQLNAERTG